MNMDDYQLLAEQFAVFNNEYYPAASLMIESAELADLLTKPMLRGDTPKEGLKEALVSEAGDVLWNLAVLLKRQGIKMSEVGKYNLDKLTDRQSRGVIKGSGGDR